MSDENDTQQGGGGEAVAEEQQTETQRQEPRNDAEAEQQEAADKAAKEEQAGKSETDDKATKQKNRTKAYIDRINAENAEMRQRLREMESRAESKPRTEQTPADGEPSLEDYDFDPVAFQRAHSKWAVQQAIKEHQEQQKQAESRKQQGETEAAYFQRSAAFADEHPDFQEVVGSIPYELSADVQAAIMAHERGPEIAYFIGNDDDAAFMMASTLPHMARAAVERLASRLSAAPPEVQQPPPPAPKPVSQAPQPVPRVTGRSPTETPAEKLTDDEWFKRERERERKR